MVCNAIISTKLFENISITVIVTNSIVMVFGNEEGSQIHTTLEMIFLALYTVEMTLKILGLGFIMSEGAYIRSSWNVLDFVIVVSSLGAEFSPEPEGGEEGGFSLSIFRAFRVLRPLKTISSIRGLKVLMTALLSAIPLLVDTLIILLFFFIIFAIAGCNLLSGELKNRCVGIQTGQLHPDEEMLCSGSEECPGGYFCGKSNENPNFGVTNFDNLFYSLLCVFQCVTLEGWSDVQKQMQLAFTQIIFIYFVPLVLIGAFFLLNLTLAVINSKFTEAHKEQQEQDERQKDKSHIQIDNELDNAINKKDEMSIAQFITARIYAKKMIEFLRMR